MFFFSFNSSSHWLPLAATLAGVVGEAGLARLLGTTLRLINRHDDVALNK